jgi:4-amino-4-deoxy-L-arabinose transferase-like glycosyltransferase
VRLVPALLASAVVPLAGAISRQLRPREPNAALWSSAIALTLLPLMRHGRLAMLDGALVSASGLLWWQLLRARQRPFSAGIWAGLGGSALLLLKAPALLPVLGAGLLLLALDRTLDRRGWLLLGAGLALGLLPGLGWQLWHLVARGSGALLLWGGDGAGRVLLSAGEGSDLGWRLPVLKVLEGGWPWLPLWPFAMAWAWQQRHKPEGRWPLGLQLAMAASVLPLRTQLPWYSHSLWLPFALVCGPLLAALVDSPRLPGVPGAAVLRRLPWFWLLLGGLLLVGAGLLPAYRWIALPGALGLLAGGWLLRPAARGNQRRLGAWGIVAGWGLSLFLLMQSPLWHWELNEQTAVAPGAALGRQAEPHIPLALWGIPERPSLSWQSQRRLLPLQAAPAGPLQLLSQGRGPVPQLAGHRCEIKANGEDGWQLWRCAPIP